MYKEHGLVVKFPWPSYRPMEVANKLAKAIITNSNWIPERILIAPITGSVPWDPYHGEKGKKHKKIQNYGRFIDFDVFELVVRYANSDSLQPHLGNQSRTYSKRKSVVRRPRLDVKRKIVEASFSIDSNDEQSVEWLVYLLCIALSTDKVLYAYVPSGLYFIIQAAIVR